MQLCIPDFRRPSDAIPNRKPARITMHRPTAKLLAQSASRKNILAYAQLIEKKILTTTTLNSSKLLVSSSQVLSLLQPIEGLTIADNDPKAVSGEENWEHGGHHEAKNRPDGCIVNSL